MSSKGQLVVISGPSGGGKGTVIGVVRSMYENAGFSVSYTTRLPRPGEVDGVAYHFVTEETFQSMVEAGAFIEHACYQKHHYGTAYSEVDPVLEQGRDMLLDIEVIGAEKVHQARPDAMRIFLLPPSRGEQERRLRARNTETEEVIQGRLARAMEEVPSAVNYQAIVINDTVERAAQEICEMVRSRTVPVQDKADIVHRWLAGETIEVG